MQRRELMQAALAAAPAALWPATGGSQATDYPKPGATLRYLVPFPPGGQIGADAVAKAAPDGNTLLAVTLTHAANFTLLPTAPYHFVKDLRPVALLAGSPMLVVVPAASKIMSFKDLVAAARSGKLNAGSSGNGTPPHLTLALFNDIAKTDIRHVPYKGGAPAITDLIGGQLDVIFSNFPESIAPVKSGKLRALAIASSARHPAVPDVPTTAEAGMPTLLVENWTALMAPAGMADAAVDTLGAEVVRIMSSPDIEERAKAQGCRVDARGPQAFTVFLKGETER